MAFEYIAKIHRTMSVKSYNDFVARPKINEEEEGKMYLQDLQEISTLSQKVREMIQPDEDLEAWVQDKITIARHNMDAIYGYYQSKDKETPTPGPGEPTSVNL